jgi:hypothetical protein
MVRRAVVGDEDVGPAVSVDIACHHTQAVADRRAQARTM